MGTAASQDPGFSLSTLMLCGGSDTVVDERPARSSRKTQIKPKSDAMRAHASASVFMCEFKNIMMHHGFHAVKYSTKGRPAVRIFRLDDDLSMLMWETKKPARFLASGDRFDHILLSDISRVHQIDDENDLRFGVAVESHKRTLTVGFDSEQRSQMFIDGLSLLIAEVAATTTATTIVDEPQCSDHKPPPASSSVSSD